VATRGSAATPPDLNVANANYYYFNALQAMSNTGAEMQPHYIDADIRSKRLIASTERDLFLRITNNSPNSLQVAVQMRILMALK